MARDFYPFVEGDDADDALRVTHPARIAVYDDTAAAPRVVVVEPRDVRGYLEEITSEVSRLSREQGGTIPFMVIREIVENFVHAYFEAPTITILDGGNTIRFSDQGPGIKEKSRALEYGTTSATEEMRHYIRGVGSGLPYAQQYMVDKGGSLEIEDNIAGGTVVTISTHPAPDARALTGSEEDPTVGGAARGRRPLPCRLRDGPSSRAGAGRRRRPGPPRRPAPINRHTSPPSSPTSRRMLPRRRPRQPRLCRPHGSTSAAGRRCASSSSAGPRGRPTSSRPSAPPRPPGRARSPRSPPRAPSSSGARSTSPQSSACPSAG